MKPIPFPEQNRTLLKPEDMSDEECLSLPCHKAIDERTGVAYYISKWELTDEERKAIAEGKPLWLYVTGQFHPPIALTTDYPFTVS